MAKTRGYKVKLTQVVDLPHSQYVTPLARLILQEALTNMVKYPQTVNMDISLSHDPYVKTTPAVPEPFCGTVACLLGHVAIVTNGGRPSVDPLSFLTVHPEFTGVALRVLYYPDQWPQQFRRASDALGRNGWASIPVSRIIARVRHFLTTGE